MEKTNGGWRDFARAMAGMAAVGLVASCSSGPIQPAPVYYRTDGSPPGWPGPGSMTRPMAAAPPIETRPLPSTAMTPPRPSAPTQITVQRGDQLGYIAERYHVPRQAIIEANGLQPPYDLRVGSRLTIPTGAPSQFAANAPPQALTPGPAGAPGHPPEIIPLDTPGPGLAPPPMAAAPGTLTPSSVAPPAGGGAAEEARADEARGRPGSVAAEPKTHGGRFPWPVQGRVVASYNTGPGGARNDGINIAAPRGTPIRAIEGGEVAYAGNELRGYGNLVLVKHRDGWISAYAHCEELLVRKGDRISPGQVIAKVGATGSVHEPQLHFELRRGKRPVDPREFLAPAPSAGATGGAAG